MVSIKEVVEAMEKKTTRNWTAEETTLSCLILADPVTKFMLTSIEKTENAATKEVFETTLEEVKTGFMEEPFKTLNGKSLKGKESQP